MALFDRNHWHGHSEIAKALAQNADTYSMLPSASSNYTKIINSAKGDFVVFRNYGGSVVKSIFLKEDQERILVSDIPQGMYFVTINSQTIRFIRY
ncbi:T9SS type A sorting domain-containing protein [Aquimarina agarilytica]|uniref:T9SS type A sorting domain-containing protein n=1 Tax=Aquimarina agarilytica TaxID=1087449 RepID=UPI000289FF82|nr:T9SS type A sorting domain-containing protein [Aquimarina agarilytica]